MSQVIGLTCAPALVVDDVGAGVDGLSVSGDEVGRRPGVVGVRDLSTIEQPPIERQPVETFVLEYNDVILSFLPVMLPTMPEIVI